MTGVVAVVLAAALMAAAGLAGQTLSDAARRAEEQRRQNAGQKVTVLEAPEQIEDEHDPTLTKDLVYRYGRARLTLTDLRKRDKGVQARLIAPTRGIHYSSEFIDILAAEPAVVTLLETLRLTPRLYMAVDIILRQALDRRRSPRAYREPTARDREHLAFVAEHPGLVEGLMDQCTNHERGFKLWWGAGPTWW